MLRLQHTKERAWNNGASRPAAMPASASASTRGMSGHRDTASPAQRVLPLGSPVLLQNPCRGHKTPTAPRSIMLLIPFSPPVLAAPRLTPPQTRSELPCGDKSAVIYSRNFAAGGARAGVTFPALPRGWQPPCSPRVGEHPGPAQEGGSRQAGVV